MAPFSPAELLHAILDRDVSGVNTSCAATNDSCVEVVCAWPLSGQYGFGQRILYYILVVTCVVARKAQWMRAVCLAAALLVPAVAAVHGIILASLHVDGATDMDIYGVLQFCSIGILAAPVTVTMSSTFFFDPGRNIIFVWTGLILSGLLSLAVEFYRSNAVPCLDGSGTSISSIGSFPYGDNDLCGIVCSQDAGPFSKLRTKAASEIFVVPKPTKFPFGMAMFLAAAECVPAILILVSMWKKILEINWKTRRESSTAEEAKLNDSETIPGTNGATPRGMEAVNQAIKSLLSAVEIPVFAGAWLAVLIIGEINFFSDQLAYHTEPIGSIGQWGTILGTGMAGLGSFYVWAADSKQELAQNQKNGRICSHCHGSRERRCELYPDDTISPQASAAHQEFQERTGFPDAGASTVISKGEWARRRKMAHWLGKVGNYFGNPAEDPFGAGNFKTGEWPHIPGERNRNSQMAEHDDRYSIMDGDATSVRVSQENGFHSDGASVAQSPASPTSSESPTSASQFSSGKQPQRPRSRPHSKSLPSRQSSFERPGPSLAGSDPARGRSQVRRATLEVPPSAHHGF